MRVQGTSSTLGGATRAVRRGAGGSGFKVGRSGSGGLAPGGVNALGSLDALLALQGIDGPDTVDAALVERGNDLLDRLKTLQGDLLRGQLDRTALEDLNRQLASRPPSSADPALQGILDDIELRAAVELAKLGDDVVPKPVAAPPRDARASLLRAYRPLNPQA